MQLRQRRGSGLIADTDRGDRDLGRPCPTQPFCERPLDGGACDLFGVTLTAAGTCHIVATAADGRQTTFDEKVTLGAVGGCCGPIYQASAAQITLFPSTDASAP